MKISLVLTDNSWVLGEKSGSPPMDYSEGYLVIEKEVDLPCLPPKGSLIYFTDVSADEAIPVRVSYEWPFQFNDKDKGEGPWIVQIRVEFEEVGETELDEYRSDMRWLVDHCGWQVAREIIARRKIH